jgi:hypothetical protein
MESCYDSILLLNIKFKKLHVTTNFIEFEISSWLLAVYPLLFNFAPNWKAAQGYGMLALNHERIPPWTSKTKMDTHHSERYFQRTSSPTVAFETMHSRSGSVLNPKPS